MTQTPPLHWLPRLATGCGAFDLPLAGRTARRLADALLAPDTASRQQGFRAALAGDPALAIWSLVRLADRGGPAGPSLNDLAAHLAAEPPAIFRRGEDEAEPASATGYPEAAGVALVTARLARRFARAESDVAIADAAQLLALVHQAPAWLVDVNRPAEAPPRPESALPAWLIESLARLEHPGATLAPHEQYVSRAMRLVCSLNRGDWQEARLNPHRWIGRWRREARAWSSVSRWTQRLPGLIDRLQTLAQLEADFNQAVEHAKLEAIKEFAYGAGHEINNPLANISARAQTLLQGETDPERRRTLSAINAQAFRAHEMIADMMLFARPPRPNFERVALGPLLTQVADELGEQARGQQTELTLHLPTEPVEVVADPTQIAVAIRSLCQNALEALVTGGQVRIELLPAAGAAGATIRVSDTGPGIPPEIRPKIFEPYFSGREAGRGLGLGLSKCWRIVTQHGGRIEVSTGDEGTGATFTIALPKSQAAD